MRGGYRQSSTKGSATQQGGVFIVLPDGSIPYRYRSRLSGDHPEPAAVVEALERALAHPSTEPAAANKITRV